MPIPALTEQGFLPPGIYDASLSEIGEQFGSFRSSDIRPQLFIKLSRYLTELRSWGHAKEVLIDGSFVSSKDRPNDIDVIVVYKPTFDLAADVSPAEYNCMKTSRVKALFGLDVFAAVEADGTYERMTTFFGQDTRNPGVAKGLIRVTL